MSELVYTLEDLENAKSELQRLNEAWENYAGNNPNKYKSQIESARLDVEVIELALKQSGLIAWSDKELLDQELDRLYPNAESKRVVEHNGKRYQRWYRPASKSNSGKTVHAWHTGWREIE